MNLKVHRLVWLVETGSWPESILDHIDGNTHNNAKSNLREVSFSENQFNRSLAIDNSSGHRGVSWHSTKQMWQQYIATKHIGYFSSKEEAIAARLYAETSSQVFIRNK